MCFHPLFCGCESIVLIYPMDIVDWDSKRDSSKLVYTREDLLTLRKRRAAGECHPILVALGGSTVAAELELK